jgi:hypothetical protein
LSVEPIAQIPGTNWTAIHPPKRPEPDGFPIVVLDNISGKQSTISRLHH